MKTAEKPAVIEKGIPKLGNDKVILYTVYSKLKDATGDGPLNDKI